MNPPGNDIDDIERLAVGLARDAAKLLLEGLGQVRTGIGTKTSSTDMVSEVDRASEKLIVGGIQVARPQDAILGEEGTNQEGTTGVRWIIDPLDGTTNYLYGLPSFAVSIGVEINGVAEVGVVLDPFHDETFVARRGSGATRNDQSISCNNTSELSNALVGTGFGYDPARRKQQGAMVAQLLANVRDIRRVGASAIDLCWVACGRLDAYFERGSQPWDHAAGLLIAAEAGATTLWDEIGSPSGDLIVASAPTIFKSLLEYVQPEGPS
ncbi:MAG: inositol monophosphatase family protein [Acidimicrobiales bacterium]